MDTTKQTSTEPNKPAAQPKPAEQHKPAEKQPEAQQRDGQQPGTDQKKPSEFDHSGSKPQTPELNKNTDASKQQGNNPQGKSVQHNPNDPAGANSTPHKDTDQKG